MAVEGPRGEVAPQARPAAAPDREPELAELWAAEVEKPASWAAEVCFLSCAALLAAFAAKAAWDMGLLHFGKPGAGLFPMVISSVLLASSLTLLVTKLIGGPTNTAPQVSDTEIRAWWREAIVYIALLGYAATLPHLGFALSSYLLVFVLIYFVGRQSWYSAALVSLAVVLPFEVLFNWIFNLHLPQMSIL